MLRDDEDDPDADSEHTVTNASEVTICVSVTGSLTALRCLGYFLGAKHKKKACTSSSSISNSSNPFIDVPALLIEPPVSTCTCNRAYSAWSHFLVISSTGKSSQKRRPEQAPHNVENVRICTVSTPCKSIVGLLNCVLRY